MELKNYSVLMGGRTYVQGLYSSEDRHSVATVPSVFADGFFIDEDESSISLMEKQVLFDIVNEKPVFTEQSPNVCFKFNKGTKTFENPNVSWLKLEDGKLVFGDNYGEFRSNSRRNSIVLDLLIKVMGEFNPYFADKLYAHRGSFNYNTNVIVNLYALLDDNLANVADKVLSAMGFQYFLSQLDSPEGLTVQTDGKKIRQVIGLPDKVLEFIKRYPGNAPLTKNFKVLCADDPNDAIALIDYIDLLNEVKTFKKTTEQYDILSYISYMADVKSAVPDVKISRLIRYLIKQKVFYGMGQFAPRYGTRLKTNELFLLPTKELHEYLDYVSMMPAGGDLYPRNLTAAHNICVRNIKISDDSELSAKFEAKVKELEPLDFEGKEFIITHPHTVKELVYEGNTLEHCVATYAKTIANGLTRVMFLRKADEPDVPFVTIEIDDDFNVTQVKEKYDIDVTDPDILEFIKRWVKKKGAEE